MRKLLVSVSVVGLLAVAGCSSLPTWLGGTPAPAPEPAPGATPVPAPPPASSAPSDRAAHHAVAPGTKGMRSLQHALNQKGFHLREDGKPGPKTTAAVRQFQVNTGIQPADGQVDGQTWSALGLSEGPAGGY